MTREGCTILLFFVKQKSNEELERDKLDRIALEGERNNWSKQQYEDAVEKLRRQTRQRLRDGSIKCR